jgi:phage terminase Nu1 subunit (DNA packaging protein)
MNENIPTADIASWVVTSDTLAAALGGVSKKTIERYAAANVVVRVGHGRYLLLQSVRNVAQRLREQAAERLGRDDQVDAARANVELKDAQRRLTQLKIQQLEEQLITMPEVQAAWDEIGRNLKEMFLSFPARVRSLLAHLDGKDQEALDQLVREMLTEVPCCNEPPRLPGGCRSAP